ncbi:MAG TPA: ATP-binding protein, partial [Longimicrobium sp.]
LGSGFAPGESLSETPVRHQLYIAGTDELYPVGSTRLARALAGESSTSDDMEIRRDGKTIPIHVEAGPIRDLEGNIVAAVAAFVDVTRPRRMEEQLRQASKMEAVGQLAGGVAHDFNNLLTAIKGNVELLLLDTADPEARRDLAEIQRAADRASDLTRQLLAFSRQQVLQPRPVRLGEAVVETARMLGRLMGEDVELVVEPSPDTGLMLADASQIEQVILNLAINARDAMPRGGMLRITTSNVCVTPADLPRYAGIQEAGEYVCLDVRDTGHGIDRATLDRIFEPFFTTKERGKGTGLGLATVYGIVMQSGGGISVESAPGEGTCFRILFPRLHDEGEPREAPAPPPARLRRGDETILVVEDEEILRRLALRVLRRAGYTVIEASDGAEARRILADHPGPLDLLLTDVVLPGASGPEIAAEALRLQPGLRVLYMSGYAGDLVAQRGMADPSAAFLQKPFGPDALCQAVREVLDGVAAG